jgi:N-terminal acetyltransferase B complex catalytic subunit
MATIRRVRPGDLLKLNLCNLDALTENYELNFYLTYLMKWPSLFQCIEEHGKIVGYSTAPSSYSNCNLDRMASVLLTLLPSATVMGKLDASPPHLSSAPHALPWHGHITVLTIAPQYRRLGYARLLTEQLERACNQSNAWFVDLYVRSSNDLAINMYRKMGYSVFRRVVDYYSDDPTGKNKGGSEDAFDMRKPLDRDKTRRHVRENGEEVRVTADDVF